MRTNDKTFKPHAIWLTKSYMSFIPISNHHICRQTMTRSMPNIWEGYSYFLINLNCNVSWYLPLSSNINIITTSEPIPCLSFTGKGFITGRIELNPKLLLHVSIFFPSLSVVFTVLDSRSQKASNEGVSYLLPSPLDSCSLNLWSDINHSDNVHVCDPHYTPLNVSTYPHPRIKQSTPDRVA